MLLTQVKTLSALTGVLFAALILAACAPPKSQVSMLQAPEIAAASKYKSISVAQFSGTGGDSVTAAIEAAMINAKIQDKSVYGAVRRAGKSRSLGSDSRSLASAARSLGTDAILTGEVVTASVNDSRYQDTKYVCDAVDSKNKWKCVSGHNVTINCLKRSAQMQVNVSLVDAATGSTTYNAAIPKSMEAKACGNAAIMSGPEMLGKLSDEIVGQVKIAIIPHEQTMNISLMSDGDDLTAKGAKERFAGAIKFAASGRMDRACETFRDLFETDKRSVSLIYNYGVCEEAAGAFWHADELYRMADRLSTEPNNLVNIALKRNTAALKKAGNLAKNRSDLVGGSRVESAPAMRPQAVVQQIVVQGEAPNMTRDALMLDKRIALVIGNAKYRRQELLNPVNDATAITNELRKANFKVIKVENASFAKMNQAIEEFGRSIQKNGVALVFYAGHGMQVKGENYLIPIDADFKAESDVQYKAVNLGQILTKLDDAKSQVNLVILDACRDNPFARSWRSSKGGLASIDAPSGTMIAFATAPGKVAADGSGANGLYTSHLLKALRVPNLKLEDVLKMTRKGVAADSHNEQVPWDSSSMTGEFYFHVSKISEEPVKPVNQTKSEASKVQAQAALASSSDDVQPSRSMQSENAPEEKPAEGQSMDKLFNSLGDFMKKTLGQ